MLSLPTRALVCAVTALALAGCASVRGAQTPPNSPPARVTSADAKNAQEAQAQELSRLAGEVKAMDAQQAFLVAELKNLGEQLAKLRSSVDEVESAVRSLRATPVPPESRPAPAPPPTSAIVPPPVPAPKTSGAVAAALPAAAPAPPSRNLEAGRVFAAARAKLRAGDDGQAALEFTEFVAQFPGHPQAAAAQNHIGEAYYRQNDFRQALGDSARAKASWEQVLKRFPKSDAARQARTLLAARPAPGR